MARDLSNSATDKPESTGNVFIDDVQTNLLDEYDHPSYHLRLYMVSDSDAYSGAVFDREKQITIAESGVTSKFNIEELSFTTLQGLQGESKNLNSTKFTFVIKEPGGASLVDRIFAASIDLGIENYFKAPYFLELRFLSRDVTKSQPLGKDGNGTSGELGQKLWIWPIIITAIETNVTTGGSEYNINARNFGELGQTAQYGVIDKAMSVTASNVKDTLDELFVQLNERQPERLKNEQSKPNMYEFEIEKELGALKIYDESRVDEQSDTQADVPSKQNPDPTKHDNTVRTIQFPKGTPIVDAMEKIIGAAPDYQKLSKKSLTAGDNKSDKDQENFMKRLHTILTECKPIEYDKQNGDYQRQYRYVILPYFSGTLRSSPGEEQAADSEKRLTKYATERLLRKHYNYIFTGLNDQVIEFDITFNYSWFVNVPPQAGIKLDWVQWSKGRKFRVKEEDPNNKAKESKTAGNLSTAEPGKSKEAPPDPPGGQEASSSSDSLAGKGKKSRIEGDDSPNTASGSAGRFLEEIKPSSANPLPLTYIEADPDTDYRDAVEGPDNPGRNYVNSLFTQAFSGYGRDLAQITMTIKGDPYWLEDPIQENNIWQPSPADPKVYKPDDHTNGTVFQNFFLFTVRTPEEADNDTGIISAQTAMNVHNGVYAAKRVQNIFREGMFTQVLEANREPLINISEIKKQIE